MDTVGVVDCGTPAKNNAEVIAELQQRIAEPQQEPMVSCGTPSEQNVKAKPTISDEAEVAHAKMLLSAQKAENAIEPLRTSTSYSDWINDQCISHSDRSKLAATASADRPPMAPGNSRPPLPRDSPQQRTRAPLAAVPVPQPTAFSDARPPMAPGNITEAKKTPSGQGGYPVIPMLQLQYAGSSEELSTRAPSCASARSPRNAPSSSPSARSRNPLSSPQQSTRGSPRGSPCQSPRIPSSPRARMTDVMHGQQSIIRHPVEERQQHRSVMHMSPRGPRTFTDTVRIPRNLAGDHHYKRSGLRASNDCLEWLKQCQTHTRVEDVVENLLLEQEDPNNRADYRYARARLRQASYRDATMSASSLAGRTKRTPMGSPMSTRVQKWR